MSIWIVRLGGKPGGPLRGRVRHVASGEEIRFEGVAELVAFLEGTHAQTAAAPPVPRFAAPDDTERRSG